ncbi:hypothetical protein RI543_000820 [Arxiozyma heterogenica]|uniref:Mid2 domain-containing protein n=1 Tax=Arxiozyma heterogenica TaxID=278026 RepID=A0AAN7WPN1_9SACH|nr:hypothetical protein RI543_000820 [Kazachstania heterogenica]
MVVLLNRKILMHFILLSWSSAQNINTNGNNNQTIQAGQQGSSLVSINSGISSIQTTTSSNEAIASAPSFSGSSLHQLNPRHIVTSVIHGQTVYSNYYTTITYSATATSSANNKNSSSGHKGLSKKNRNIVIGCVVGIGVPLLILIAVIIYIFCIQSKKTNFIDSNGNVVTAYKRNKVMKLWYSLIGKNVSDEEYESKSPLGSAASDEEMILDGNIIEPSTVLNLDDEMNHGFVNRNGTTLTSNTNNTNRSLSNKYNGTNSNINGQEGSNDLVIPEEKYYDEHGNELNAKNY